ncbi:MAG TPA: SDR family NAD(P)-dependent oxidoreductase [Acidimicrobiia bacterium]|nr:SDR family NAD(P)-dependent oxidoreductase [Acidimicrobiia bacterium]
MKVAVTGGSGVVGTALVRQLVAEDDQVVALARSPRSAAAVEAMGATALGGDIMDPGSLKDAFSGCEVIYHVAGINEMCSLDPDRMHRVNVDGTRNVVRACQAAGVRRMVLTSSAAAIGEEKGEVATESTPHRGHYLSEYEKSKHHSERLAFAEAGELEVVAVNPSSVQGPGRATGTGKIILQVLTGKLPLLIESQVSMIDIDDCARGHLLAARHGTPGERYLLSGFTTSVSGAVAMAGEVLGREVNVRMLPLPVAWAGAAVIGAVGRVRGKRPRFCPEMIRVVSHGHLHDGSRATRELGLTYTPARETITRMVDWFRSEGLL